MKKEDIGFWVSSSFALIFILLDGNWEPFVAATFIILSIGKD